MQHWIASHDDAFVVTVRFFLNFFLSFWGIFTTTFICALSFQTKLFSQKCVAICDQIKNIAFKWEIKNKKRIIRKFNGTIILMINELREEKNQTTTYYLFTHIENVFNLWGMECRSNPFLSFCLCLYFVVRMLYLNVFFFTNNQNYNTKLCLVVLKGIISYEKNIQFRFSYCIGLQTFLLLYIKKLRSVARGLRKMLGQKLYTLLNEKNRKILNQRKKHWETERPIIWAIKNTCWKLHGQFDPFLWLG